MHVGASSIETEKSTFLLEASPYLSIKFGTSCEPMDPCQCCGEVFQPGSMSGIPYQGRNFVALSRSQRLTARNSHIPETRITTQPYSEALSTYPSAVVVFAARSNHANHALLTSHFFGLCDNSSGPFDGTHTHSLSFESFRRTVCPIDRHLIGCHALHRSLFIESVCASILPDPARSRTHGPAAGSNETCTPALDTARSSRLH